MCCVTTTQHQWRPDYSTKFTELAELFCGAWGRRRGGGSKRRFVERCMGRPTYARRAGVAGIA
eukprot:3036485-Lingulodinium_polyedra.AAC.1